MIQGLQQFYITGNPIQYRTATLNFSQSLKRQSRTLTQARKDLAEAEKELVKAINNNKDYIAAKEVLDVFDARIAGLQITAGIDQPRSLLTVIMRPSNVLPELVPKMVPVMPPEVMRRNTAVAGLQDDLDNKILKRLEEFKNYLNGNQPALDAINRAKAAADGMINKQGDVVPGKVVNFHKYWNEAIEEVKKDDAKIAKKLQEFMEDIQKKLNSIEGL